MTQVAIFIGSASDDPIVGACAKVLKQLGISYRYTITSAHRTPERTAQLMDELEAEGVQVYICAAGMAAHLAGAVAARTIKPVIGIPVATVALNGAKNAAWLAAQIVALSDERVAALIRAEREGYKTAVESAAVELEERYA